MKSAEKVPVPPLRYLEANDKTQLAYREYIPEKITAILIFYHGGGTYSAGGYQYIGNGLSNRFNILVITPDIRGHGDSGGTEGDTPSPEQVFDDIGVFIRHMKAKYIQQPVFLGGHSSGGGTILNYSSYKNREEVRGYIFIAPHLGFRSKTEIENPANPFSTVKTDLFIQNALYKTHGNSKAVFFNYSEEILQNTKNIAAITVNMANAQTPTSPKKQLHLESGMMDGGYLKGKTLNYLKEDSIMRKIFLSAVSIFLTISLAYADSGLVFVKSPHAVKETADRLETALKEKGMTVFKRIDHSEGAKKVGIDLPPTELIIFGNPKVGSPLMKCNRTAGIDLPQKALIWEDENGQVWLSYNDPQYLAKRHDLSECMEIIKKVEKALSSFAKAATEP